MKKRKHPIFYLTLLLFAFSLPAFSLAVENEECIECHSDESLTRTESEGMKQDLFVDISKFNYSVHNANGITCIDCHSDIEELNWDDDVPHAISLPVNCDNCHEDEAEAYVDSVHKKAGGKGITIPCHACHGYHYVSHLEADSVYERENGFCLKCHNPDKYHDWLPQKETHFEYVECTVCHALEAPRHINLRLYDLISEKFLDGDEFLAATGTTYETFMPSVDKNQDGVIDLAEFDELTLLLRKNNIRSSFHGELVVKLVPEVHHVNRGVANRECEQCHMPTSPFFEEVLITLNRDDGTSEHHKVTREILSSYHVSHFYALGGTRISLLDQIGMVLIAGGAGVVVCHLVVRIATAPVRRRRKEKEAEEERQKSSLRR